MWVVAVEKFLFLTSIGKLKFGDKIGCSFSKWTLGRNLLFWLLFLRQKNTPCQDRIKIPKSFKYEGREQRICVLQVFYIKARSFC